MFRLLKWIFIIALILISYKFYPQILSASADLLISEDMPEKVSAIVVMAGDDSRGSRVDKGIELLQKGYAPFLILSGNKIGWNTYETEIMLKQASNKNIPEEKIIALKSEAESTISEGNEILKFCKKKKITSILIVTSDYHTRRTAYTFKKLLDSKGMKILVTGTENLRFQRTRWWKNRSYAKTFFLETCKLVWYYTAETFLFGNKKEEKRFRNSLLNKFDDGHVRTVSRSFPGAYNPGISSVSGNITGSNLIKNFL